jgi:hypothetical protein
MPGVGNMEVNQLTRNEARNILKERRKALQPVPSLVSKQKTKSRRIRFSLAHDKDPLCEEKKRKKIVREKTRGIRGEDEQVNC